MRKLLISITIVVLVVAAAALVAACNSSTEEGQTGTGTASVAMPAALMQAERCAVCHPDAGERHQAGYDELYQDDVVKVTNLMYTYSSNTHTVSFEMTKNGAAIDANSIENIAIYFVPYTGSKFEFEPAGSRLSIKGKLSFDGIATTTSTLEDSGYGDLSKVDGFIAVYGRDETVGRLPARVQQAKYIYGSILETGAGVDYVSPANNAGCEKCHSVPYAKHGYILGQLNGDSNTDFYLCKACHLDNGEGGHIEWQLLVENPEKAAAYLATDEDTSMFTAEELAQMAYETSLMNDVHMSHAMEFPYPQSMVTCATCHEGKLDQILTADNMNLTTCQSCHPKTAPEGGTDPLRAPALADIIPHPTDSDTYANCASCHNGGMAPEFSDIHTGYDPVIYADASGTKYSDKIKVSVDSASLSGNKLTMSVSATGSAGGLDSASVVPEIMIGLYGYDTKDFIVNGHDRYDSSGNGEISRADGDLPKGAYEVGTEHKYFTTDSEAAGKWTVTTDLTEWAGMIKDGTIKRVEIAVLPMLDNADGEEVALNAVSRTFDLTTNAFADTFFTEIIDIDGCNNCHDALGTTFHSPDYGGKVTVCRMCHVTLTGGSHLEVQSRSIDSYVHAIHSGQAFDIGDINFDDPVEAMEYQHHIEFPFPTHGRTDCEACHNPGTYNVPSETASLPGVLSASDDVAGRDISGIPSYVTGPGSRACGGCHRADLLNEDDAAGLDSFLQHTKGGGYLAENGDGVLDSIINAVMKIFH